MKKAVLIILATLCTHYAYTEADTPDLDKKIREYTEIGPESAKNINFIDTGQVINGFPINPTDKIKAMRQKIAITPYPDKYLYEVFINVVHAIEAMVADYIYEYVNEPHVDGKLITLPGTPEPTPPKESVKQEIKEFFEKEPAIDNFLKSILHRKNLDSVSVSPLIDADENDRWEYYTPGVKQLNQYLFCVLMLTFGLIKYPEPQKNYILREAEISAPDSMRSYYAHLAWFYTKLRSLLFYKSFCTNKDLSLLKRLLSDLNDSLSIIHSTKITDASELQKKISSIRSDLLPIRTRMKNSSLKLFATTYSGEMILPWRDKIEKTNSATKNELAKLMTKLEKTEREVKAELEEEHAKEVKEKKKTATVLAKRELESLEMTLRNLARLSQQHT